MQPLGAVRNALKTNNIQQIANSYDPILDGSKALAAEEQEQIRFAVAFAQGCNMDDDDAIVSAGDAIHNLPHVRRLVFTPEEEQRIDLARRRHAALAKFRLALYSKRAQAIDADYEAILDSSKSIDKNEREVIALARNFVKACRDDDDDAILQTSGDIENFVYARFFEFTPDGEAAHSAARERVRALALFMMALNTKICSRLATRTMMSSWTIRKISHHLNERD